LTLILDQIINQTPISVREQLAVCVYLNYKYLFFKKNIIFL
jgi:hypothetical protein